MKILTRSRSLSFGYWPSVKSFWWVELKMAGCKWQNRGAKILRKSGLHISNFSVLLSKKYCLDLDILEKIAKAFTSNLKACENCQKGQNQKSEPRYQISQSIYIQNNDFYGTNSMRCWHQKHFHRKVSLLLRYAVTISKIAILGSFHPPDA